MHPLVITYPDIDPVLFAIGPFAVRWYALAYIVGILLGWWYVRRLIADERLWDGMPRASRAEIDDFVLWATIGIVLGGRLGFVLFYNLGHYVEHPAEILAIWQGGMSFHGGMLGVIAAIILFARSRRLNLWSFFDVIAAAVPIGLFFGRIANFVNGELWGRVSDAPWAMVFPTGGPDPRHPSQLYEALLEGVALFVLLRLVTHRWGGLRRPGLTAGTFAVGYGVARTIAEQFRQPDPQLGFLFGGVTMGMLLSLPMIAVGVWAIWRARAGRTATGPAA